jgi:hypothetical protein
MKITFLVGLPGSGKTHYGNQICDSGVGVYLDDISVMDDPLDSIKTYMGWPHILISDVFLCREQEREKAVRTVQKIAAAEGCEYDLEWVFFENNPDQCLKNVAHRAKQGDTRPVAGLIRDLTKEYKIPEGVEVRKIWDGAG